MSYIGLDAWKENAPEIDDEPLAPCIICTGNDEASPCSESCQHIIDTMQATAEVRRIYEFCRRALGLARQYRDEERVRGRKSRRFEAVMQQVGVWREDVRHIRMAQKQKKEAA